VRQAGNDHERLVFTAAVGLIAYLGPLLGELRKEQRLNRVRIGFHLTERGKSESALGQFERGNSQPRDLDSVVEAYAEELGIEPLAIWRMALERYEATERPAAVAREVEAAARSSRRSAGGSERDAASKRSARRRAAGQSRP
jgi:hypothetical protein